MDGLRNEIRNAFKEGDALTRLVLLNIGVFLGYLILKIFGLLFQYPIHDYVIEWLALPSNLSVLITRPWTVFTYMFLHQGFLHLLFNMLWLYFAGKLFMEYLGGRKLLSTYILGGLVGGVLYVIAYNVFPLFTENGSVLVSTNRGASAGVMAVVFAVAAYHPRYPVKLFFTLKVEMWVIAALALLTDLINIGDGNNIGGHIAHLGGALFGYLSIKQLRRGHDLTEGFSKIMDTVANWFKPKPKLQKVHTNTRSDRNYHERKASEQQKMNSILDKINQSGYDSLSKEEKAFLFKIGDH